MERTMEDERIHDRIEQLVSEEHELYERGAGGGLSDSERRRLESIKVGLDQCWDLLRQRRALREGRLRRRRSTCPRPGSRRALRAVRGTRAATTR
jgi:hypothetical protein